MGLSFSIKSGEKNFLNKPDSFVEFVKDQFEGLSGFEMKRMFGGHGLYLEAVFFGILVAGQLYFKTTDESVERYRDAGSKPFSYFKKDVSGKKKKVSLRRYYEVPLDVLENQIQLKQWAKQAAE